MKQNRISLRKFLKRSLSFLFFAAFLTAAFGETNPGCSANRESRKLDYWLGNWTVTAPDGSGSGKSEVYLSLDKCMLVERWDGGRGHIGENVFAYSADDKNWYGMFVDNEGRVHIFTAGRVAHRTAEFQGPSRGPNGEPVLNRVRIVRVSPNKVEQIWEKSSDKGVSWQTAFRGEYSRRSR